MLLAPLGAAAQSAQAPTVVPHSPLQWDLRNGEHPKLGAIQVAEFEDPTPREVADLIDQVKAAGVPAIFGSEGFEMSTT